MRRFIPTSPKKKPRLRRGLRWPAMLVLLVLALRTFACAPFMIPSESMVPNLLNGDYLIAAKWPYGYSRASAPFGIFPFEGTVLASLPERGDIAIFRHEADGADYIKRVIGLPGDTIAMQGGVVILNGRALPRRRIEDFRIPITPNSRCAGGPARGVAASGEILCRYPQYLEMLPDGKSYRVVDSMVSPQDNFGPVTVPQGRVFVLGDNRDNSLDSRFPPRAGGGVGLVQAELMLARAGFVLFSWDGSAGLSEPWTWPGAVRWHHLGGVE